MSDHPTPRTGRRDWSGLTRLERDLTRARHCLPGAADGLSHAASARQRKPKAARRIVTTQSFDGGAPIALHYDPRVHGRAARPVVRQVATPSSVGAIGTWESLAATDRLHDPNAPAIPLPAPAASPLPANPATPSAAPVPGRPTVAPAATPAVPPPHASTVLPPAPPAAASPDGPGGGGAPTVGPGAGPGGWVDQHRRAEEDEARGVVSPPTSDDDLAFAHDLKAVLGAVSKASSTGPSGAAAADDRPFPPAPAATAAAAPDPLGPAAAPSPSARADAAPGVGAAQRHDIFDRMGAQLAHANRYDLGPIALSETFDVFDRTIDFEERASATRPEPERVPPAEVAALEVLDEHLRAAERAAAASANPAGAAPSPVPAEPQPAPIPAPVTPEPAPAPAPQPSPVVWRVVHDVHVVPQVAGITCWATAAASMVGWRDSVSVDAHAVANATGHWERYADGRSARGPESIGPWPLTFLSPAAYDIAAVRALLERHGPLLVAPARPGEHVLVLAGLTGDGTASGTTVDAVDPWSQGMTAFALPNAGSRLSESWTHFVNRIARMGRAAESPGVFTIAHLRPRDDERS